MTPSTDGADRSRPIDPAALAASLGSLGRSGAEALLRPSLQQVAESCVDLFRVDGAGIMLVDDRSDLRYVVATDEPGRRLEDAELQTGEGPCIEAFVTRRPVTVLDLHADRRWPVLSRVVADSPIRGVVGVPIHLSGAPVGTLDVYRSTPTRWEPDAPQALLRFAEVAEQLMRASVAAERADELAAQLTYALEHRAPIERAVGFLMARRGLPQPQAFELLRSTARSTRRRIGDVATELLSTGRLGEPGPQAARPGPATRSTRREDRG
jgi:GAF domain-containing protein